MRGVNSSSDSSMTRKNRRRFFISRRISFPLHTLLPPLSSSRRFASRSSPSSVSSLPSENYTQRSSLLHSRVTSAPPLRLRKECAYLFFHRREKWCRNFPIITFGIISPLHSKQESV